MRRIGWVLALGTLLAAMLLAVAAPAAFAEDQGEGCNVLPEFARTLSGTPGGGPYEGPGERPTVGDIISDGFYGNEPNIESPFALGGPSEQEPGTVAGRVEPAPTPGPAVTNPDGSAGPGRSIGDVNQQFCTH